METESVVAGLAGGLLEIFQQLDAHVHQRFGILVPEFARLFRL
jgi:hypothetical protein